MRISTHIICGLGREHRDTSMGEMKHTHEQKDTGRDGKREGVADVIKFFLFITITSERENKFERSSLASFVG